MSDDMPAWATAMEGRLQGGLTTLEGRLQANLTTLRSDLMEPMHRLQNSMTLLRDDISVNLAGVETVRRANDNTREELRALGDVVSAMHRQIHRLQTDVRELRGEP